MFPVSVVCRVEHLWCFPNAEGGEAEIIVPAVCGSNSVVDIIFYWPSQARGTIWWFFWVRKVQAIEVKKPVSGAKSYDQRCNSHWINPVSGCRTLKHWHTSYSFKLVLFALTYCSKFEREFNNELQSLGPILSSSSQAEPYLTHLAQLVLGVGFDKWIRFLLLHLILWCCCR